MENIKKSRQNSSSQEDMGKGNERWRALFSSRLVSRIATRLKRGDKWSRVPEAPVYWWPCLNLRLRRENDGGRPDNQVSQSE